MRTAASFLVVVPVVLATAAFAACGSSSSSTGTGGSSSSSSSTGSSSSTSSTTSSSTSSSTGAGGSSSSSSGAGGSSSSSSSGMGGAGGSMNVACPGAGMEITTLPKCGAAMGTSLDVKKGCTPTVDGVLHADEWMDAQCINTGDLDIYMKYDATTLYVAASGMPTCGCPMGFYFDPDKQGMAMDEFLVALFDDPFNKDGDRTDFRLVNGKWIMGAAPMGIVTACPGKQPNPIRYEIAVPFAALGITPKNAHDWGFAFVHAAAHWPSSLKVDPSGQATDTTTFGKITSSANWTP